MPWYVSALNVSALRVLESRAPNDLHYSGTSRLGVFHRSNETFDSGPAFGGRSAGVSSHGANARSLNQNVLPR
jgi:hypothetical protein